MPVDLNWVYIYDHVANKQTMYNFSADKSVILLDVEWPPSYPNILPIISMDSFFNRNILPSVKADIVKVIQ